MDLSIVIPAYNEEKRILIALEQTPRVAASQRPWSCELLVVDDGSTDRTVDCIAEYVLCASASPLRAKRSQPRQGLFRAARRGRG